ncbi:hypothetical protein ZIOFF_032260 [Zingiber officinale]|uniref:Protein EARLY FLOWERING 4 domain-containing protein n=1 Tax=Zingiber officinale TaxID=94328 RepID=A0A8J5GG65_ZINOF|nr:hypothetical protein ZIOFF_032260 [Zingiber officinale]
MPQGHQFSRKMISLRCDLVSWFYCSSVHPPVAVFFRFSFLDPSEFGDEEKATMERDTLSVIGNRSQVTGSFLQVQSILDQNRLLINEINQNHNSKTPDDLSRNVGLIRELNNNIRRAVDLYGDLSVSFADSMGGHKRNTAI